jgi:glycosyltransferase involved in cell wall biosynthesis
MRILICSNRYFVSGGPERYMFSIMKILEDRGHTVIPFAMDYAQNEPTPYSKYFVSHPVDRQFVYFSDIPLTRQRKIRLLLKSLYNREARIKVEQAIQNEKIELVYALQIGNYLSPGCIVGAHRMNIPIVARQSDFHLFCPSYHFLRDGQPCEECKYGLYHAIKYRCLKGSLAVSTARVLGMYVEKALRIGKKIRFVITPTNFMREKLIEFGYPPAKVVRIPTPIDAQAIEPCYTEGTYLLYTGNLNPQKGVRFMVEAMRHHPEVRLKIAGKSSENEEKEIQEIISRHALRNVDLVGFKTGKELGELYRGAIALIMPTLWYENMPNSVLEAMAYGKPLIASSIGSMPELVEDGGNGFLVKPGDSRELADAIKKLLSDRNAALCMGKASRARVLDLHSIERHYSGLHSVFLSCVESKHTIC